VADRGPHIPTIATSTTSGLHQWHDGQPPSSTFYNMESVAYEQNLLGWNLLLEGAISTRWQGEQDLFYKTCKSWRSSRQWMMELIHRLVATAWDMWHHCNAVLHESPLNHQAILNANINLEIRVLYNLGLQTLPKDALKLCKHPLEKLIQIPSPYKHQWVDSFKVAQTGHRRQLEGLYRAECQYMQQWVIREPPNY